MVDDRARAGGAGRRAGDLSAGAGERARAARSGALDSVPAIAAVIDAVEARLDRPRPAAGALLGHRAAAAHHARRQGPARDPALGRRDRRRRADASRVSRRQRQRDCRMVKLTVNVNKVATAAQLARRARAAASLDAVRVCVEAGAPGITVHPRADARHITPAGRARRRARAGSRCAGASSSTSRATPRPTCSRWSTRCSPISARWCRCCPAR